ncbi:uncharacterized protein PAC_06647 [Phialocephala subalpina]|uniref:Zn(2)-C6 fungal-type domain-containing protein n=1 Tax=Phialocephala subalpina TaxID=576137 RepID=A0A1L7WVE9_9HELO|nr:uncharacterized protein PAC_06647 [Phialocephala subalpina]
MPRGKSRSGGCRTCKTRRIKCDEAKPSCSRCLKSGRSCDGYGIQMKATAQARASSLSSLDTHSYRSERENRGFDYFRHKALSELIGFDTKSDFWSHVVLQFSEASPAVFRAVLSLSSLHESTYSSQMMLTGSENTMSFLRQYNKAIRQLCSKQTTQPVQFTLTCCILFICLENLRGDYDAGLLHLKNGLEILKEWHAKNVTLSTEIETREILTKVFRRLDMQATAFLDTRQPQFNMSPSDRGLIATPNTPPFNNLSEARTALDVLVSKLFYIITTKSSPQHPSWSADNMYLPMRRPLMNGLNTEFLNWKSTFDTFSLNEGQNWQKDELRLGVLLGLHYQTTSLMLDIRSNTNIEGQYCGPSKDTQWTKITDICESIIRSLSTSTTSFSADMGLIAPLYFTAMQAENPRICQRGIDLLHLIRWKEGFWDASTAAAVAERVLRNQIAGTPGFPTAGGGIAELGKLLHCVVTCC